MWIPYARSEHRAFDSSRASAALYRSALKCSSCTSGDAFLGAGQAVGTPGAALRGPRFMVQPQTASPDQHAGPRCGVVEVGPKRALPLIDGASPRAAV